MAQTGFSRRQLLWMLVATNVTAPTVVFVPAGPWESCAGITGARGWGEMAARNGNIQAAPAVQFANDPRTPDSTSTAIGAALASNTTNDPTGIVGLTTGGKRYVRVGWNVSLTSGTTLATAMVSGIVEFVYT